MIEAPIVAGRDYESCIVLLVNWKICVRLMRESLYPILSLFYVNRIPGAACPKQVLDPGHQTGESTSKEKPAPIKLIKKIIKNRETE